MYTFFCVFYKFLTLNSFTIPFSEINAIIQDLLIYRVYVRTTDGRQGWLPTSILMQTTLSEESSLMSRPEDSHYRREYVIFFCNFSNAAM